MEFPPGRRAVRASSGTTAWIWSCSLPTVSSCSARSQVANRTSAPQGGDDTVDHVHGLLPPLDGPGRHPERLHRIVVPVRIEAIADEERLGERDAGELGEPP